MIWGCFSYYGVEPIHWIKTIMDQHIYINILQDVMLPYASEEMTLQWTFQQDNDPKHTSKLAKKWFKNNNIEVIKWPAQSPDLNLIENLWTDVKKAVFNAKPKNTSELWQIVEQSWKAIPQEKHRTLVDSMKRL